MGGRGGGGGGERGGQRRSLPVATRQGATSKKGGKNNGALCIVRTNVIACYVTYTLANKEKKMETVHLQG